MLPTTINHQTAIATQALGADAYTRFLMYCDAAPATLMTYKRNLQHFFGWLKDNGITAPNRATVIAYRDALTDAGKKPTTVQNYIAALRVFFGWTSTEGIYPDIARKIKTKVTREHKKDCLAASQLKTVLHSMPRESVKDARNFAIMFLMSACALRTVEVSRLSVEDITTAAGRPVVLVQGKGRNDKTALNLPPEVEQAIRAYWVRAGITSGAAFQSTSNNNAGEGMTTRAISGMVKATLQAAGYNSDRLTAHSLRHSSITAQIVAGAPLYEVQAFARHADISTTMIYNHAVEARANKCADNNAGLFY